MLFGYARASVGVASIEDQEADLYEAGCAHVFADQEARPRPQLAQAIQAAAFGDTLIVTRLDRLAVGTADLLATYQKLAERGAWVRSLSESLTDPATEQGRHFTHFLAWCAAFDAATFAERMQSARRKAAQEGVRMGRPPKLTAEQEQNAAQLYTKGDATLEEVSRLFRISPATLSRIVNSLKTSVD